MHYLLKKVTLIILLTTTSGVLLAATNDLINDNQTNYPTWHVVAQLGYAYTNYSNNWLTSKAGFTSVTSTDRAGYSARFGAGYDVNPYLAIEAGYLYLPKIMFNNINNSKTDAGFREQIVDLVAKVSLPVWPKKFGLFIKPGIAYMYRKEVAVTINNTLLNSQSNGGTYVPTIGAGLYWNVSPNFYTDISAQYYTNNHDFKSVKFVGLGLGYIF
ncbi:MAG: outer membrane beta-barrel protein [Pseudomonadota bacterium]